MNKEKCMTACNAVLDLLQKDFNIGVGWLEMLNVIAEGCVTVPIADPSRFEPETKIIGLNDTFSLRADIERLKQDFHATRMFPQFDLVSRLIDIVDRLEQRPPSILNLQTTPVPNPVIFPTIQADRTWPTKPYIGDPPGWISGGTICKAQSVKGPNNLASTGQSVSDATGVSTEEPL